MTVTVAGMRTALTALDQAVEAVQVARGSVTAAYRHRGGRSSSHHAPLPVDVDAIDKKISAHRALMDRALMVAFETDTHIGGIGTHNLTNYLFTQAPWIVEQAWAGDFHAELVTHTRKLTAAQDRREPKVFAGKCAECDTDLYAVKGQPEARCKTCGTTYEVLAWREMANQFVKYQYIGTPADLSRKLTAPEYGYEITADQIRKWALRGKLSRANPSLDEQDKPIPPAYRIGDVLKLADEKHRSKPLEGRTA